MESPSISWNQDVRLIISDVDETVAGVYELVRPEMAAELCSVLDKGTGLLLVSGGGLAQITRRITDFIPKSLRRRILIGPCNGAELWGFSDSGLLQNKSLYSAYEESFSEGQKVSLRQITQRLLSEFGLRHHHVRPINQFTNEVGLNPMDIMLEDRGAQITLELVNAYNLSLEQAELLDLPTDSASSSGRFDLRRPVLARANELFLQEQLPITARPGGVFAVDFAVSGINKATPVRHVMDRPEVLSILGLGETELGAPSYIEVWGDKFSKADGGADSHMSEALAPEVRSISFRNENSDEFAPGYNIVTWDGSEHLERGLLQYLRSRS